MNDSVSCWQCARYQCVRRTVAWSVQRRETPNEFQDEEDKQWNMEQEGSPTRVTNWGKYMLQHARRQLSFGIVPLSLLLHT